VRLRGRGETPSLRSHDVCTQFGQGTGFKQGEGLLHKGGTVEGVKEDLHVDLGILRNVKQNYLVLPRIHILSYFVIFLILLKHIMHQLTIILIIKS
jgi:hypothetical protein